MARCCMEGARVKTTLSFGGSGAYYLLSFSRSARESHRWLREGNDDGLLCHSLGDSTATGVASE